MNHRCPSFIPKRCDNCNNGKAIKEFDLVECFIYNDLMFKADNCPLWE